MFELRKELMNKIKISTGNVFSDEIYEKIMTNEDLTINALFADKEFQSRSILYIKDAMDNFNVSIFKEGLDYAELSINWLELKIGVLELFQIQIREIINDFYNNKQLFNEGIFKIYENNATQINIDKDEFIKSMQLIKDSFPMRILNIIYLEENFIATQSFDKKNIELFYY